MTSETWINQYLDAEVKLIRSLPTEKITALIDIFEKAHTRDSQIFLFGNGGNDTLFGDGGYIDRNSGGSITEFRTHEAQYGGNDQIDYMSYDASRPFDQSAFVTPGLGNAAAAEGIDLIFGGTGNDTIDAGLEALSHRIFGDNGKIVTATGQLISTDSAYGGQDEITGSPERDYIIGGAGGWDSPGTGGDIIAGMDGDDILFGDGADIVFDPLGNVVTVMSVDPAAGGNDHIDDITSRDFNSEYDGNFEAAVTLGSELAVGGEGSDVIVGGELDDSIDVLIGDNARVTLSKLPAYTSVVVLDNTTFTLISAFEGIETLTANGGNDDLFG